MYDLLLRGTWPDLITLHLLITMQHLMFYLFFKWNILSVFKEDKINVSMTTYWIQ